MEIARKLTTDDYYGWVEPMTYAGRAFQTYFKWLWNAGGSMFNEDYTRAMVNSPEAVEALEFVINMFNEGIVPPFGQYDNVSQEDLFMRGGVAMGEFRQLAVAQMQSDFPDLNFDVVISPKGPAGTQYSYADWGYYGISERCPHKEEAWKWVKYITSKEVVSDYLNECTLMPAMKDTGLFADDPILSYFVANIDKNKSQPIHPQSLEILQLWWAEVELAVQGKKSAKAASDAAAKAINDLLSK
jgi:multiple sugar transport system substrate-binding protein